MRISVQEKYVSLTQFRKHFDHYLEETQHHRIIVTKYGRPIFAVLNIEDYNRLNGAYEPQA